MRLGQLARKLALRPVEIINYLASQSIQIDSGSNTRIEDDHVSLILKKFAPNGLPEDVDDVYEDRPKMIEVVPFQEVVIEELVVAAESSQDENKLEEKIEVIKAPKIELSGLKVLGKIELPEPKKKDMPVTDPDLTQGTPATEQQPHKESRDRRTPYPQRTQRPSQSQRPAKNPVALQREREALEAEEKRKANLELEKEKRALHYLKKVNTARPTKAIKIAEERVEEKQGELPPAPTTWWGKFKRWMNT